MKTSFMKIGIVGGMSWRSSVHYYKLIQEKLDQAVKSNRGCVQVPHLLINNLPPYFPPDFKRHDVKDVIIRGLRDLQNIGAEMLAVSCNTAHYFFDDIQSELDVPILHIAKPLYELVKKQKSKKIGLIATKVSIKHKIHEQYLKQNNFDVEIICPDLVQQNFIEDTIVRYCNGYNVDMAKKGLYKICEDMLSQGVDFVWLGCTELGLILNNLGDSEKIIDSAVLHSQMILNKSLVYGDE